MLPCLIFPDCGDPSPTNGIANTPAGTTFDETATISCNPGYDVSGSSTLICLDSGWNDTATCTIQGMIF